MILINENENSHRLIEKSQAIFSVSGSIAYEAALMEKPAFLFSNIFFENMPFCKKISLEDIRNAANIYELVQSLDTNKSLSDFKDFIYTKSFKGLIGDPLTNADTMKTANIDLIASAFDSVINS